jgi:putative oxidoreductase
MKAPVPLLLALRLALGGLFIVAGLLKLRDPSTFANEVANYHLVPALAPLLAATLPAIEILSGAVLVIAPSRWRTAAALLIALMMGLFSIAVSQVLARGINISCGCFGGSSGPVTGWTLARDIGLLASAVLLVRLESTEKRP